jgi:ADP-ribose pyrophosphatase
MRETLYKGRVLTLEREKMTINGSNAIIERIIVPRVVVIIPFLKKDVILMEINYRPAIRKHIFELPAGKVDRNEKPIVAARRELGEEAGYESKQIHLLFKAYLSPGASTELAYFYKATQLEKSQRHLEEHEVIELKPIRINRLLEMIRSNEIKDSKTIAGILYCTSLSS